MKGMATPVVLAVCGSVDRLTFVPESESGIASKVSSSSNGKGETSMYRSPSSSSGRIWMYKSRFSAVPSVDLEVPEAHAMGDETRSTPSRSSGWKRSAISVGVVCGEGITAASANGTTAVNIDKLVRIDKDC